MLMINLLYNIKNTRVITRGINCLVKMIATYRHFIKDNGGIRSALSVNRRARVYNNLNDRSYFNMLKPQLVIFTYCVSNVIICQDNKYGYIRLGRLGPIALTRRARIAVDTRRVGYNVEQYLTLPRCLKTGVCVRVQIATPHKEARTFGKEREGATNQGRNRNRVGYTHTKLLFVVVRLFALPLGLNRRGKYKRDRLGRELTGGRPRTMGITRHPAD